MRKRLRKKNRQKVDRHIAYCQHFGLPIILDESSKWKRKHSYRLRAMMEKQRLFKYAPSRPLPYSYPPEWWSEKVLGLRHVPIREVLGGA